MLRVFTDGACSNNGRKNAKAGIGVYFGENDERNISKRITGKQTNNTAELSAVIVVFNVLKEEKGETIPRDKFHPGVKLDPKNQLVRRWNERAIVYDDAAYDLAAIGAPAIKVLDHLLIHKDPWVVLNALFALGEIGPPAKSSIPKISKLLDHELQEIVRQALDTLIYIGGDLFNVLPKIKNLHHDPVPYDGGLSLGAARYVWHHILDNPCLCAFLPIMLLVGYYFSNRIILYRYLNI